MEKKEKKNGELSLVEKELEKEVGMDNVANCVIGWLLSGGGK